MFYITRPVMETHKTVPKTAETFLDNNLRDRNPSEEVLNYSKEQRKVYQLTQENLRKAVEDTNRVLFRDNERFEFRIHEGTGRVLVKLVDNDTDEIIKEIPPEKILDLVASIWDLVGILVDERG